MKDVVARVEPCKLTNVHTVLFIVWIEVVLIDDLLDGHAQRVDAEVRESALCVVIAIFISRAVIAAVTVIVATTVMVVMATIAAMVVTPATVRVAMAWTASFCVHFSKSKLCRVMILKLKVSGA